LYHYVAYSIVTAIIVGAIIKLYRSYTTGLHGLLVPVLLLLIGIALLLVLWFSRSFALKAQDRAIRAEESLRYFAITGNLPDSKLTLGQFIALRFAPNNEFVDLAHRAVSENMTPRDIKKAIKQWKADHNRV